MVKHIILWTLNPELSEEEKKKVKAEIKAGLEGYFMFHIVPVKHLIDNFFILLPGKCTYDWNKNQAAHHSDHTGID